MNGSFCKQCGAPLQPGVPFCAQCGHAVTAIPPLAAVQSTVNQQAAYPYPANNKGKGFIALAIVFFVLAAGIFTAALLIGKPQQTASAASDWNAAVATIPNANQSLAVTTAQMAPAQTLSIDEVNGTWSAQFTIEKVSPQAADLIDPSIIGVPHNTDMVVSLQQDGKGTISVNGMEYDGTYQNGILTVQGDSDVETTFFMQGSFQKSGSGYSYTSTLKYIEKASNTELAWGSLKCAKAAP